jgi:CRISPR/Cas system Type II protein with McrA/HNH and RuvC-like nuclease domain
MSKEELLKNLRNSFSDAKLRVWRRAKFCCEYCDKKLTLDAADYYYDSHIDHIVPNGTEGAEQENLALTCKACNFIKRAFDPSRGYPTSSRSELILLARQHIDKIRARNEERRVTDLAWLQELDRLENGT